MTLPRRLKVYLAGPMRGYAKFNFPAFDYAAERLRQDGFEVFSPAERDRSVYGEALEQNATGDEAFASQAAGFSLAEAIDADLHYIATEADAIALLPGWEKSSGAQLELQLAKFLNKTQIILGGRYVRA